MITFGTGLCKNKLRVELSHSEFCQPPLSQESVGGNGGRGAVGYDWILWCYKLQGLKIFCFKLDPKTDSMKAIYLSIGIYVMQKTFVTLNIYLEVRLLLLN